MHIAGSLVVFANLIVQTNQVEQSVGNGQQGKGIPGSVNAAAGGNVCWSGTASAQQALEASLCDQPQFELH